MRSCLNSTPLFVSFIFLFANMFLAAFFFFFFFPTLQMGNCTGMFSQAFSTETIPTFVSPCFTVHKAPFNTSTQSLYRLDKLVMSHLLISVQLAHLAQPFTAAMLHLEINLFLFFQMNSQHFEPALQPTRGVTFILVFPLSETC